MADEKEFKQTDAQLEYQHHDGTYRKQNNIVENPLLVSFLTVVYSVAGGVALCPPTRLTPVE